MPKIVYSKNDDVKLAYHFFTEKDNRVPNLMKITGITESALNRRLDFIMSQDIKTISNFAKNNNYGKFKKLYNEFMELR